MNKDDIFAARLIQERIVAGEGIVRVALRIIDAEIFAIVAEPGPAK